MGEFLEE